MKEEHWKLPVNRTELMHKKILGAQTSINWRDQSPDSIRTPLENSAFVFDCSRQIAASASACVHQACVVPPPHPQTEVHPSVGSWARRRGACTPSAVPWSPADVDSAPRNWRLVERQLCVPADNRRAPNSFPSIDVRRESDSRPRRRQLINQTSPGDRSEHRWETAMYLVCKYAPFKRVLQPQPPSSSASSQHHHHLQQQQQPKDARKHDAAAVKELQHLNHKIVSWLSSLRSFSIANMLTPTSDIRPGHLCYHPATVLWKS